MFDKLTEKEKIINKIEQNIKYIIKYNDKYKMYLIYKILLKNNELITIKKDCILFTLNNISDKSLDELNTFFLKY